MLSEDRARQEGKGCSLPADAIQTNRVCAKGGANGNVRDRRGSGRMRLSCTAHPESYLQLHSVGLCQVER